MSVLREKPITRMDGIHVGDFGGADDPVNPEIALAAGGFANADGLIGDLNVHGTFIRLRIDGDGPNIQLFAGANDSNRNLSAVGNQNLLKHAVWIGETCGSGWQVF